MISFTLIGAGFQTRLFSANQRKLKSFQNGKKKNDGWKKGFERKPGPIEVIIISMFT